MMMKNNKQTAYVNNLSDTKHDCFYKTLKYARNLVEEKVKDEGIELTEFK